MHSLDIGGERRFALHCFGTARWSVCMMANDLHRQMEFGMV
jgi:hypothetical protein